MRLTAKPAMMFMFFFLVSAGFPGSGAAEKDEIVESINEGLEYYQEGDLAEAVSSLDYAAQLIRQKRAEVLETFLPEPLSGWKAKDIESKAVGQAMLGGMVSAKREYLKGSSSVTLELMTDSPTLQGMFMLFNNPAYATADGGKLKKIKRQKAIVKYRPANRQGEISIVVDNRYLLVVKGRKVSEEDLTAYASAIDFKGLKKF
ncbi:MAG: hypothetical protein JRK53_08395 [Deltaproteobacteria bacterium]|nr:hypothetical protein [Deltaproteobacteria bacterium]MBW1818390.1 hypothetical protein [Deltaproteobacteria bacterium]